MTKRITPNGEVYIDEKVRCVGYLSGAPESGVLVVTRND